MTTDPTAVEKLLRLVDNLNAAVLPAERREAAVAYTRHLDLMSGAPTVEYTRDLERLAASLQGEAKRLRGVNADLMVDADDAGRRAREADAEAEGLRAERYARIAELTAAPKPDAGDEELAERFWRNLSARDPLWVPWEDVEGKDEIAGAVTAVIRPLLAERDARIAELTARADRAEEGLAAQLAASSDLRRMLGGDEHKLTTWVAAQRVIRERDEATARAEQAEAKVAELTKPGPATDGDLCEAWRLFFDAAGSLGAWDAGRRAVYDLGLAHGRAESKPATPPPTKPGPTADAEARIAARYNLTGEKAYLLGFDDGYMAIRSAPLSVARQTFLERRTKSGEIAATPPPAPGPRYVAVEAANVPKSAPACYFRNHMAAVNYAAACNADPSKFISDRSMPGAPAVYPWAVVDTRPEAGK